MDIEIKILKILNIFNKHKSLTTIENINIREIRYLEVSRVEPKVYVGRALDS